MARNPMKIPNTMPSIKNDPYTQSEYSDKNLMAPMPLNISTSMPSDRLASPASLAAPKRPAIPGITRPERSVIPEMRKERFKRLMGILKPKQSL